MKYYDRLVLFSIQHEIKPFILVPVVAISAWPTFKFMIMGNYMGVS